MIQLKKSTNQGKRLVISGPGGCGKSTAIEKISRKPIIFDLEEKWPAESSVPIYPLAKVNYDVFKNELIKIRNEQSLKEYDWLWLDSMSELGKMCEEKAIEADYGGNTVNYSNYSQGVKTSLPKYFNIIIDILKSIQKKHGINVGFIAHTIDGTQKNPAGEDYLKTMIDMKDQLKNKLIKDVDYIGVVFDSTETKLDGLKTKATESKRYISFDSSVPYFDAKGLRLKAKQFLFDELGQWYKQLINKENK